jgi:hypothetical protein
MFVVTEGNFDTSNAMLEQLVEAQRELFDGLGLQYRVRSRLY